MQPLLYGELTPWYHLVDPPADHRDEALVFREAAARVVSGRAETLLELGAGAGNNGLYLKEWFRCTLSDLSVPMFELSRARNPECEHVPGDMRTLRLGRTFDVVLIHDAICYMTSRADLAAAIETAFVHTRPGGAAIFVPDRVRDTFVESTDLEGESEGSKAVRTMMWTWDPDPNDETYTVDFTFLLREGSEMRAIHDRHVEGLFSRATWRELLEKAGFTVAPLARPLGDGTFDEAFLCTRT